MCSHYLFEPDFCNRAAGWEKGIVEKNVQDRRRRSGTKQRYGAGRRELPSVFRLPRVPSYAAASVVC
ncbi:hypothetical protein YK56LOC_33750 [Caballeronia sp. HLA56]